MATQVKWSTGPAGDEEKSNLINAFRLVFHSLVSLIPIFSLALMWYTGMIPFYSSDYPHSLVHFLPYVLLQIYNTLSHFTKGLRMLNQFSAVIILGRLCWIVGLILDCSQQGSPESCSQNYFIHFIIMIHLAMLLGSAHW